MDPHLDHRAMLVPWTIDGAHRWSYALSMLRMEAGRRAGAGLSEDDARRLETWLANLRDGDLVIDYNPGTDVGFCHVPRRRGIDHDLIREPDR